MSYEIIAVTGAVNYYLLKTPGGFFMVDTGFSFSRGKLKKTLENAGCKPGGLKLVIITHADADHTGNCLFLREKYGAKIAIHQAEARAIETVSMTANRKTRTGVLFRAVMALSGRLMSRPLKPDFFLKDGDDLSMYGLAAKVIHTPGHSLGSISVLTADGDLFCGDFLKNGKKPGINSLVDDPAEMAASLAKIKGLNVRKIYPGHGRLFTLRELL